MKIEKRLMINSSLTLCIGCGSSRLHTLDSRTLPRGVTSDAKPWPRSGAYVICEQCGHTQKILNDTWRGDVASIYGGYEMYFLSGGSEQLVFDHGPPLPRTKKLIEKLRQCVSLPAIGAMLDVGCAVGSTLRTFNSTFPRWRLAGFDITSHSEAIIRSIPASFHTGTLDDIDEQFDLVTMLFVVEHLPDPRRVLEQFRRLVKPGGIVWIHTSDFWANPFDLTVVDHASHFMVDTLAELAERSGFCIIDRNDDWNVKEMGIVARLADGSSPPQVDEAKRADRLAGTPRRLQWLGDIVDQALSAAGNGRLAILGTSFAATWLANMVEEKVALFVDEDRSRVGKTHLGLPVVALHDAPADMPVFLAFPPCQAKPIRARLLGKHPLTNFVVPPPVAAA
jgi:SAM-dependent methyltransferase